MIAITAATGKLGHHVVSRLLERVPASELVLAVRSPSKAEAFARLGVHVRHADYDKPESLPSAFAGVNRVLLISSSEIGQRERQHTAAVGAAVQAGVQFLAYTSILRADHSTLALAAEHRATEACLRASGIPHAVLRNGWYLENYTENLGSALESGVLLGAAGEGRIAAASRFDLAQAAAEVMLGEPKGRVYELCGDEAFTLTELASAVSAASGKGLRYQDLPQAAYRDALIGWGVPPAVAAMLADSDAGISRGQLDGGSRDLSRLIGRPTTPLSTAIHSALSAAA